MLWQLTRRLLTFLVVLWLCIDDQSVYISRTRLRSRQSGIPGSHVDLEPERSGSPASDGSRSAAEMLTCETVITWRWLMGVTSSDRWQSCNCTSISCSSHCSSLASSLAAILVRVQPYFIPRRWPTLYLIVPTGYSHSHHPYIPCCISTNTFFLWPLHTRRHQTVQLIPAVNAIRLFVKKHIGLDCHGLCKNFTYLFYWLPRRCHVTLPHLII